MYSGDKAVGPDGGPEAHDDARLLLPQLQRALAAARDAVAAQQALDDSPEAIGQAARKAAHEFNNLLTVVGSSVELLRHPGLSPERRERYLAAIESTTDRAALMTRDIQALARRLAPRKAVIDLGPRMGALARQARVVMGPAAPGPFPVLIDPADFDEAILSFAHAGHDGGADDGARLRISLSTTSVPDGQRLVSITLSTVAEATAAQELLFATQMLVGLTSPDILPDAWRKLLWFAARYAGHVVADVKDGRLGLTLLLPLHQP